MNVDKDMATWDKMVCAYYHVNVLHQSNDEEIDFEAFITSKRKEIAERKANEKTVKDNEKKATDRMLQYANGIVEFLGLNPLTSESYEYIKSFLAEYAPKYKKARNERYYESDEAYVQTMIPNLQKPKRIPIAPFINRDDYIRISEELSGVSGLYCLCNEDTIYYIGKSTNLATRIFASLSERYAKSNGNIDRIMIYPIENIADLNIMEIVLISENNPVLNTESNNGSCPALFKSGIDIYRDFEKVMDVRKLTQEDIDKLF